MHLLLVSATPFELAPCVDWLSRHFQQTTDGVFERGALRVQVLVTGVGSPATAFQLGYFFAKTRPSWVVNAGIAGSFDTNLPIGQVVQVLTERFGDLGVEEADGRFRDIQELGFGTDIALSNPQAPLPQLPVGHGITVNKVHGSATSIQRILEKYPDIQIESMEGAAFFYACLAAGVTFSEIRSISNRVEPRNREAWDLPLAIGNLNEVLIEIIQQLAESIGSEA